MEANIIYEPMPYGSVLIVDDMELNLIVAEDIMLQYELTVDTAESGFEAIEKIKSGAVYDIVFMDHLMPKMSGVEAAKIMRELGYASPIVALTAKTANGEQEMFLENGFDEFISKPIDIRQLDAVLKKLVRDRQPPQVIAVGDDAHIVPQDIAVGGDAHIVPQNIKGERETVGQLPDIPGLDVGKGMARYGYSEDAYANVVQAFARNTRRLLDAIREANPDKLEEYAVAVHGIKGSSYGIFANTVGAEAEALENAATAGDFGFVAANNQKFLETALRLVEDIEKALAESGRGQKLVKEKPDAALLVRLLAACESFDVDEMDAAMAEIESYCYASDDGLAVCLRDNLDQGKYNAIKEKLTDIAN